ncbi:hypothetical protein CJ191_01315 [Aerococcus viridans]|uniref:Uncharacterized protein n=1 Tax=Aerococcus viridans TaxID=1377 RepID=A0A2N6UG03_9LACT|nr:hypothetical protein [Aerococcus viridans]PMC80475.1 hypothetical protein CJ191_01315 [Aerococcus viridans]
MNKKIKTLALTAAVIGLATVIKRVNGLQTQINEIKTTQSGLKRKLNLKVDKNNLIKEINLTPEKLRINSSKLEGI